MQSFVKIGYFVQKFKWGTDAFDSAGVPKVPATRETYEIIVNTCTCVHFAR
jgi:hypothetical protein